MREYADATRKPLETRIGRHALDLCIGTGGNVEALGDLRTTLLGQDDHRFITAAELATLVEVLQQMTLEERMQTLDLRLGRADVARYHRKSFPALQHEPYKVLPAKDRVIVSKLAALLRLADALDTEHTGNVADVGVNYDRPRLRLTLHGQGDLLLEKWALVKRARLFEDVFGVTIVLVD